MSRRALPCSPPTAGPETDIDGGNAAMNERNDPQFVIAVFFNAVTGMVFPDKVHNSPKGRRKEKYTAVLY